MEKYKVIQEFIEYVVGEKKTGADPLAISIYDKLDKIR